MHFVRIKYDRGSYSYAGGSDLKMDILGSFLTSDVRCTGSSFKDWALEDSEIGTSSNITELEKKMGTFI